MEILDKHMPVISKKIRSTDAPWIDVPTRKMIKQRNEIYDGRGREEDWHEVKAKTTTMIRERKSDYYKNECLRLTELGSHNMPYKIRRNIAEKEQAPT